MAGMDTGTHLRAIWRRRWWVLAGAALVGLSVLVLRTAAPSTYTSQATLFLVLGEREALVNDGSVRRLTAAYVQLRNDEVVVADAARRAGVPEEVVRGSASTSSGVEGQVVVSASADSPAVSARLANALADAVSSGARRDQVEAQRRELAPLDTEIRETRGALELATQGSGEAAQLEARLARAEQARLERLAKPRTRLDVVERAQPSDAIQMPRPGRDAGLAFVIALIVLAELAALRAARRQALEGPDVVASLEEWTDLPIFRVGAGDRGPDETAAAVRFLTADPPAPERLLALAPLAPSPGTDEAAARLLAVVADFEGEATWLDLDGSGAGKPVPPSVYRVAAPSTAQVRGRLRADATAVATAGAWESPDLVRLAEVAPAVSALLVDARLARRSGFDEALRVLGLAGVPPIAVLVAEPPRRWWPSPWRPLKEAAGGTAVVASEAPLPPAGQQQLDPAPAGRSAPERG
jgi:hypothetical protein